MGHTVALLDEREGPDSFLWTVPVGSAEEEGASHPSSHLGFR